MPTTLRNTDILFNDGTTQNTAAGGAPSAFNAIGSVLLVANFSTSNLVPGNNVAGSNLLYVTGFSATAGGLFLEGSNATSPVAVTIIGNAGSGGIGGRRIGNWGAFQPNNTAFLSGTWRVLVSTVARSVIYAGYTNETYITYNGVLVQRIS